MILELLTKFLWAFLALTRPVSDRFLDLIFRITMGRKITLPPIRDKILLMSATKMAQMIRSRKLKSEEVMRAYIDRIQEVNPLINACVDERFEDAVTDAKAVDKMLVSCEETEEEIKEKLPLLGVPFSCKEIVGVKGLAITFGLKRFKSRKAPTDGATAALYRRAGAIPVVVTNIPTISMWWETSNFLFGRTKNPYDHRRMVGGSSGGEASLIASAGSVIGIGTDIGGSIRIPACFCGVYGHKPSRGIISNYRPTPKVNTKLDPFLTTGPMCRYAEDLPLLTKILSAEDAIKLCLDQKVDFKTVQVFYMEGFPGLLSATSDIKTALMKAVKHFQDNFEVTPTKLHIEEMRYAFDIWQYKFLEADDSPLLPDIADKNGNVFWPWEFFKSIFHLSEYDIPIVYFASIGKRHKDKRYHRCLKVYQELEDKLGDILHENAILLLPTHPEVPPHCALSIPKVENTGYTTIFNILGYPVSQIPAGLSKGLPIGIQAVAARNRDVLTLAAAIELEKVFGGWKSPCPVVVKP